MKRTGFLLKLVTDRLRTLADANLKAQNLTLVQSRIIGYLSFRNGRATQKELERFLEVAHPTVVGIVSRMEQNGYVECRTDRLDRRNKVVSLTEKSRAAAENLLAMFCRQDEQMFQGFTEEEQERFDDYLFRIYQNLGGTDGRAWAEVHGDTAQPADAAPHTGTDRHTGTEIDTDRRQE